jgi:hypothetical protein
VWAALSEPGTVRVDVYHGNVDVGSTAGLAQTSAPTVASATSATLRVAARLHIAVVTAELVAPALPLAFGTLYSYNLTWTPGAGATSSTSDLRSLGLLADGPADQQVLAAKTDDTKIKNQVLSLGYQVGWLPSFATVPTSLDDLKIVHGSCNKMHGYGGALLPQVDDLIAGARTDPLSRPHQLFLTGDQIYADEVAACLLPQLDALAQELMGDAYEEKVAIPGAGDVPVKQGRLPAGRRQKLVAATGRLSTDAGASHLISFGEFASMYLLSWSPACWPDRLGVLDWPTDPGGGAHDLWQKADKDRTTSTAGGKTPPAVLGTAPATDSTVEPLLTPFSQADVDPKVMTALNEARKDFLEDKDTVTETAGDIWKVRRALANVPVYAICDDHEITDDWYITDGWRTRVLGNTLGKAIVRNGMTAYVLFQAWGNQPKEYATDGTPFKQMLTAVSGLFPDGSASGPAASAVSTIEGLLGLGGGDPPLRFHFSVDGSTHRVIVMDSRTRREYATPDGPPALLSRQALLDQIPAGPLPAGLEVLVLISPAPVLGPSLIEEIGQPLGVTALDFRYLTIWSNRLRTDAELLTGIDRSRPTGAEFLDIEGWSADHPSRERLLARLAPYGKVVILAGDVHYGATLAMTYTVPGKLSARIVNFTSSALHNAWMPLVTGLFKSTSWVNALQKAGLPAGQLGWAQASPPVLDASAEHAVQRGRVRRSPVLLPTKGWKQAHSLGRPPEWLWDLELISDTRAIADRFESSIDRQKGAPPDLVGPDLPPFPTGAPIDVVEPPGGQQGYGPIAARHGLSVGRMWYSRGLLFANNVSLVEFTHDAGELKVSQTLYSLRPDAEDGEDPAGYTKHETTLAATPIPTPATLGPA